VNAPAVATLTLVWLGAQKPDAVSSAALAAWARDHGATLEDPRPTTIAERTGSAVLVERCETWLEQARDQLQGGDDQAAQVLLVRLDQLLRQHPELLQASWFMAERYRLEARIARRASPEQALRFEQLAEVTEGARAPAFGEPARARTAAAEIFVSLVVHGPRRHEIYWDGMPSKDDVATTPGEHHLLVFRGTSVAWAGWVSALGPGKIDVWVPDAAACSMEDFEGVALEGRTRVRPPPGVRCAAWIAAAPIDRSGALSIALCEGDRCQPMITLGEPVATGATLDERRAANGFLPAWAAWTLAGVGVAAATSIVLWRAGVFDAAPGSKIIYDGSNL
jgi:hypothetical protein